MPLDLSAAPVKRRLAQDSCSLIGLDMTLDIGGESRIAHVGDPSAAFYPRVARGPGKIGERDALSVKLELAVDAGLQFCAPVESECRISSKMAEVFACPLPALQRCFHFFPRELKRYRMVVIFEDAMANGQLIHGDREQGFHRRFHNWPYSLRHGLGRDQGQ